MENKNENIDFDDSSSSSSNDENNDSFDIDKDQLTLIDVNKKLSEKRSKKEQNSLFLKLKRKKPENTMIIYNSFSKKILNVFCPTKGEMEEFLEKCKVEEININEFKNNEFIEDNIFNPKMFMQKNKINKSYLSWEDLEFNNEENEDFNNSDKYKIPLIEPEISNISKNENNDTTVIPNDPKKTIKNILKTDILGDAQKEWLNNHIKEISKMHSNSVLLNGKKLEVIFDIDNTLIFNFIQSYDKKSFEDFMENYQENDLNYLSFSHDKKKVYSAYIIRQGVEEFIEYTKKFCNFNINTLAVKNYATKIIKNLEKNFKIKFQKKIMRTPKENKNEKSIDEFECDDINYNNALIFDDNILKWENDFSNVITSKFFFDKNAGINFTESNSKSSNNNLTFILNSHKKFFYHYFYNNENKSKWKEQNIGTSKTCPFFHFKEKDEHFFFDIYNAEYFNSNKKQFIYMKDIVKIIYYMVYHDKIPLNETLLLIRLNVLYKKYFYLKYVNKQRISILSGIINICGGEIIEPDESIEFKIKKKIFLVCSFEIYEKERNNILNEVNENSNYLLVNEKFVLDCYYFMTDLADEYQNEEYNPEICYQESKAFMDRKFDDNYI